MFWHRLNGKLLRHIERMINAGKKDAFKSNVEDAYEINIFGAYRFCGEGCL